MPFSKRKLAATPIRCAAFIGLGATERRLRAEAAGAVYGPVCFILGPPRSGTTLVYEMLVRRFGMSYTSNLANFLFTTPAAATRLGLRHVEAWRKTGGGRYENEYGQIAGWGAPNEGGNLWDRWLPRDEHVAGDHAKKVPAERIRRTMEALARVMGGPFVNKNVMHSVHMELLDRIFPGCVFVQVERDPLANVRSIVRYRLDHVRRPEDLRKWRSVKPRAWKRFAGQHHAVQAAAQVLFTHADVRAAAADLGDDRRFELGYEAMCADPEGMLEAVGRFLRGHGVKLNAGDPVSGSFSASAGKPMDDESEQLAVKAIDAITAEIGSPTSGSGT